MVNAVYCGRCKKLFPKDKTCKIKAEFSKYTEAFEDDYCEKCVEIIEEELCGLNIKGGKNG